MYRESAKMQMLSNGNIIADSLLANTSTEYPQWRPTVSALSNGSYILAWNDESGQGGDTSSFSVKAQIFSSLGQKLGSEFLVNSGTKYSQIDPIITEINDQSFLISWNDEGMIQIFMPYVPRCLILKVKN
jgi:trimeric autotransporter adhesin